MIECALLIWAQPGQGPLEIASTFLMRLRGISKLPIGPDVTVCDSVCKSQQLHILLPDVKSLRLLPPATINLLPALYTINMFRFQVTVQLGPLYQNAHSPPNLSFALPLSGDLSFLPSLTALLRFLGPSYTNHINFQTKLAQTSPSSSLCLGKEGMRSLIVCSPLSCIAVVFPLCTNSYYHPPYYFQVFGLEFMRPKHYCQAIESSHLAALAIWDSVIVWL